MVVHFTKSDSLLAISPIALGEWEVVLCGVPMFLHVEQDGFVFPVYIGIESPPVRDW